MPFNKTRCAFWGQNGVDNFSARSGGGFGRQGFLFSEKNDNKDKSTSAQTFAR
jgi:hypothetical protein